MDTMIKAPLWPAGHFRNTSMQYRRWLRRRIRKGKRDYVPAAKEIDLKVAFRDGRDI
jgi:hypothetical protein